MGKENSLNIKNLKMKEQSLYKIYRKILIIS